MQPTGAAVPGASKKGAGGEDTEGRELDNILSLFPEEVQAGIKALCSSPGWQQAGQREGGRRFHRLDYYASH